MLFLVALSLPLLLPCPAGVGDPPPLFAKLALAEAREKAQASSRFLLVDFTASWCAPCRKMDQVTWIDPRVVAWVERRALAIQVDIDAAPELARELHVSSVPQVVVFRDGQEFDRLGGFRDPAALLAWLEGVESGEHLLDSLRRHAAAEDPAARHELARALLERRENAEALPHYLWLWDHGIARRASLRAVRLSYWAAEIGELCRRLPAARTAFTARRDEAFSLWSRGLETQRKAAEDWLALTAQLRDREQTLRWYEAVRGEARWQNSLQELREDVYQAYVEKGDYRAAGSARGWPGTYAEQLVGRYRASLARAGEEEERRRAAAVEFRRSIAILHAAMLACGSETWAAAVARTGLAADDSADLRIALVAEGLSAKCPREEHLIWLEEARRAGGEIAALRSAVRRALDQER